MRSKELKLGIAEEDLIFGDLPFSKIMAGRDSLNT